MYTVKVSNPGHTDYYPASWLTEEVIEHGFRSVQFGTTSAKTTYILFPATSIDSRMPDLPTAERIYLINDQGKTVEVFKCK